jgi:hypothetical protein
MKNKKLRDLIAQKKDVTQPNAAEVSVLNGDQLAQLLVPEFKNLWHVCRLQW